VKALIENRFGLLGLVLLALLALYGVAHATRPDPAPAAPAVPRKVMVESVRAVCPAPGGSAVSVVTPPVAQGVGTTTISELKDGARPLVTLDRAGELWQRQRSAAAKGPLVVSGAGALAAGLEAAQTSRATDGVRRGLAGTRCVEPGADAWLIGPGPAAADVTLHLTNADAAPAIMKISIVSGEGSVLGEADDALLLAPGEHRALRVRDIAPSPLVMAVGVRTSSGRVAVAAEAHLGEGKGTDWLPLAAGPSTRVVVPGLPGGGGRRELLVAAPGDVDSVVQVKVVTPDGSYALKGREELDVPAGSVSTLDLSTGVGGLPAAVVLTSEVPIVAGMIVTGTGDRQDVAFAAGAGPVDLGSVVADNRTGGKRSSRLVLTAPEGAGKVRVEVLPERGPPPAPIDVEISPARTKEIKLPAARGPFGIVVTPVAGSGPVYGGRVLDEQVQGGLLLTIQPLAPARVWTLVPDMTDSPVTVLP
jgi:hypothetical protein